MDYLPQTKDLSFRKTQNQLKTHDQHSQIPASRARGLPERQAPGTALQQSLRATAHYNPLFNTEQGKLRRSPSITKIFFSITMRSMSIHPGVYDEDKSVGLDISCTLSTSYYNYNLYPYIM